MCYVCSGNREFGGVSGRVRRALSSDRQDVVRETDAKEDGHSIAKNSTHRRSAAHTDLHFCQQDPRQMEPVYRNMVSVQVRRGIKTQQAISTGNPNV